MKHGTSFEDRWRNYCWLCEWCQQCQRDRPCEHFHPPDWMDFHVAEVVDDQDMRQELYMRIVRQMGGEV